MRAAFQWAFLVLIAAVLVAAGWHTLGVEIANDDARLRAFRQAHRESR